MGDWRIDAVHEWIAHDPFGRPKPGDLGAGATAASVVADRVRLSAACGAYASFRVLVSGIGAYRISAAIAGVEVDLAKAWYHRLASDVAVWWPGALIPTTSGASFALPDPENAIADQTVQEFWVDLRVPRDAEPGERWGTITLDAAGATWSIAVVVEVLPIDLPAEPTIVMDKNAYGCRWLERRLARPAARSTRRDAGVGHLLAAESRLAGAVRQLGRGRLRGRIPPLPRRLRPPPARAWLDPHHHRVLPQPQEALPLVRLGRR